MIKKLFSLITFSFLATAGFLSAEINYEIHDIDTLQTHSSEAIAINNIGQILGSYNVDGTAQGQHFFVRDKDGTFYELHEVVSGLKVNWKHLNDNGIAYGEHQAGANTTLFAWDSRNGEVKLGIMPGKEIMAINNLGQVLIKAVSEMRDGKSVCSPIIWQNGKITALSGLTGDLGVESVESYGFDMNNKGEVVGESTVSLVYKNKVYYQTHAVKWINGKAIDLHKTVPKQEKTSATAINDKGNMIIHTANSYNLNNSDLLLDSNSVRSAIFENSVVVNYTMETSLDFINKDLKKDYDSPWLSVVKLISMNDSGEIIAEGKTIYGEKHIVLLTPIKTQ